NNITVEMEATASTLDEFVVTGTYGTARALGSMTGSVSAVTEATLKDRPVANIADALQGQVAGLQSFVSSGEPSATFSMRLRGVNSINAGNTPLLIVDGSPVTASAFHAINSNDIESVVILKDASSTAIYGSRAANGVVIVTTKRGKINQKASIQISAQYGISQMANDNLKMLNAQEYLYLRELADPNLVTNATFQEHKEWALRYNINTNWKDIIFKNSPVYQFDVSATGTTDKTNYYLSAGYFSQEGITHHSSLDRMTLRSNIDTKLNDYIRVGVNIGLSHEKYRTTFSTTNNIYNPANFARWTDPSYSPYEWEIDANGNIVFGERWKWSDELNYWNPEYVMEMQPTTRYISRLIGTTFIELTPMRGLTIRASQSTDSYDYRYNLKRYPDPTEQFNVNSGEVSELFQRYYSFNFTNTAEYRWNLYDVHNFTVLLAQESLIRKNEYFQATSMGQTDRRLMLLNSSQTPAATPFDADLTETVFNSYFGRINYDYDNKYYFDATLRRDGSSLFGKDARWGTFYSLGALWNIKGEGFLYSIDFINDLRLRLSYGTTGNSSIDDYMWIGSLGNTQYNGETAWRISNVQNNDLTWETVGAFNLGVSGRMWNRFDFEVEFYKKKTTDMLLNVPYSYTTGHESGWGNVGEMTNTGVDITLGVDILNQGDFYWNFSTNFNYNKNKITKLYDGIENFEVAGTGMKYEEGHAYGEFFYAKYAGVNPANGEQLWYTPEGDLTNVYSTDLRVFTGKQRFAPIAGGISTQFQWKGIGVAADFSYVLKKYALNNDRYFVENPANISSMNQTKAMLNMWTTPGQITDIPKAGTRTEFDTRYLENASFGRLKNLTLSYTFPKYLLNKTGFLEGARIYGIGRNLFTITDYTGYDPEVDSNLQLGNYPNTRQYQFGVELTF
ncbi:MAG: SusC/RagA family TonB-linked outer membrane protein, partial [Odoribacter sp.]|nr:SusC/RagA family TonB-linked outer membrane protein [Odoribacter sp.]